MENGERRKSVSEMDDAELILLLYDLANEIESRFMERSGEPLHFSDEESDSLPF